MMHIIGVRNTIRITLKPTADQSTPPKPNDTSPAPTRPPSNVCEVELGKDVNMHIMDHINVASIVESKNINPAFCDTPTKTSLLISEPTVRATSTLPIRQHIMRGAINFTTPAIRIAYFGLIARVATQVATAFAPSEKPI